MSCTFLDDFKFFKRRPKGSVSFEHQISTVASCGIKLAPGVAADALLQSCDREAGKLE